MLTKDDSMDIETYEAKRVIKRGIVSSGDKMSTAGDYIVKEKTAGTAPGCQQEGHCLHQSTAVGILYCCKCSCGQDIEAVVIWI